MSDILFFDKTKYEVKSCELEGRIVRYRAYEGLPYCSRPAADIQKMNVFVPEAFFEGEAVNGYTLESAPIFIPLTVGGYMEGALDEPGYNHKGRINTIFEGLQHGYVVVAPGIRGRNTGTRSKDFFEGAKVKENRCDNGRMVGRAPALIVDLKAVIRYIRHNRENFPGDCEKIFTNGTSAGGALSSLAGATGNAPEYEQYLDEIGAAKERDDILGASCYCPIHNLENADAAYEWLFNGENKFYRKHTKIVDGVPQSIAEEGVMSEEQMKISDELKTMFPTYVNKLGIRDKAGKVLSLDADGEGSFKEYVKSFVISAAQKEIDTHDTAKNKSFFMVPESRIEEQQYLKLEKDKVTDMDWNAFVKKITRMKCAPAFDAVDLKSPECEEFGTEEIFAKHFTKYAYEHSTVSGELADAAVIRLLNPLEFIDKADTAKHWRIRHGVFDRDTSLAIPVILATVLMNSGYDVDFELPWGLPHSGDYDIAEMFAWIDGICQ